ncbi:MAG: LPS export ABC transporter periplasmic protein LptC, partial [Vicinamibacterales bacterium]
MTYDDGSTKQFGVQIWVRKGSGRDFVVSAREAQSGANQRGLRLTGDVHLVASDGFELATENATYDQDEGLVRAPGHVSFRKGRLRGSGAGMTYDEKNDVLSVLDSSQVTLTDEADATTMSFSARTATLDRVQDFVRLDGGAHVTRGEEVLDSTTATARLSGDEQIVTFIELRGESRVVGGDGSFESMTARDIDLDYTDDGQQLERVALMGGAAVALAPASGSAGRKLAGETLDLQLASDGSVTHASGRDNVRLDLPAVAKAPERSIKSKTFDASGQQGAGLTDARFVDDVEYRELAGSESPQRVARSRGLQVSLTQDDVRHAVFTGGVAFEEASLSAVAGEARYDPGQATLQMTGGDGRGGPRVSDEQVTVAGPTIDLA